MTNGLKNYKKIKVNNKYFYIKELYRKKDFGIVEFINGSGTEDIICFFHSKCNKNVNYHKKYGVFFVCYNLEKLKCHVCGVEMPENISEMYKFFAKTLKNLQSYGVYDV